MKVAFRCDTSTQIGSGHFSRCYQLARAFLKKNHQVFFLSRDLPRHYRELLSKDQIEIVDLGNIKDLVSEVPTIKDFLQITGVDLLVVDNYEIDESWEQNFNWTGIKILAIDDLHNRKHFCHFLLDQNILSGNPYENLVLSETKFLLGPKYSLINPKFQRNSPKEFHDPPRVLVFFGGMDHVGATLKYIPTFKKIAKFHAVTIVAGSGNEKLMEIKEAIKGSEIGLEVQLPDLHETMNNNDLFIGAGGVSTWERCAMGLPSIIVSIAENQEDIAAQLASKNVQTYLGTIQQVSNEELFKTAMEHLNNSSLLETFSSNSLQIVSKSGINTVVEALDF